MAKDDARNSGAITGTLAEWKSLPAVKGFEPAFEFLAAIDAADIASGRTPIVGDEVYAITFRYTTRAVEASRFEAHRKFIDIQCVFSGREVMGFLPSIDGLAVLEPYNSDKDIAFFAVPESFVSLTIDAGQFAIFHPGQGHMPSVHYGGPHDVVKIVVKVSAAWHAARAK